MNETKKTNHSTLDASNPGIGTWNGWYIAIVVFNLFFILLMAYLFEAI